MRNHGQVRKRVVMVLGMARCGTSTIARGLQAIGVNLGSNLHEADARNPKGFWEDADVTYKVNRGILRELDYPWSCESLIDQLQRHDNPNLNAFKHYAINLVRERLAGQSSWGFKDTNTAALLPFWQSVLMESNVDDSYVIALRNPLGCAYSNIKHSNLELEAGLLAWLKCMVLAIENTHDKKRVVVSYDLLLNDPMREVLRMSRDLAFESADPAELEHYANNFVDKKLHHHAYTEHDLTDNPAMSAVPLCFRVYALLARLANDTLSFSDDEFSLEWRAIKHEFDKFSPLYDYASSLLKQNQQLERSIRTIYKSIPWRLLFPLFLIDDALRAWWKKGAAQ